MCRSGAPNLRPSDTQVQSTEVSARPTSHTSLSFPLQMLAGLIGGITLGLMWPSIAVKLQPLGTAFTKAVQMVVIPLVFSAVTLGIYRMGTNLRRLGRVVIVAFAWFYLATVVLALLALGLNGIFHPGAHANLIPSGPVAPNLAISLDWTQFALDLIPSNILAVMAAQKILPTLIFAVLFGLALAQMGTAATPVVSVLETVLVAMFRLVRWVIATAPIAIFGLMAWLFATQGKGVVYGLAKLIGIMYLSLGIAAVLFCAVIALVGKGPLTVMRQVATPVFIGFVTRSSEVTLPVHMEVLERMGVPSRIVSIVLPLGYSFNLSATVLYLVLATMFLAEAHHVSLTWSSLLTILVTTMIASKGVASVVSGGLIGLATVLAAIGLPVEAIALIVGVDPLMDMGRTAINVFGNTVAVLLVQRFAGDAEPDITRHSPNEERRGGRQ